MGITSGVLAALTICCIILYCEAQDSPQDFLDLHNSARAKVGVEAMTWDDNVAAYAQDYANQRSVDCSLVHSNGPYGENLAKGSGDLSAAVAMGMWVDEKANYEYNNANSCVGGGECLHYTQVVWRNSTRLGCAKVQCQNNAKIFITCNYDSQGNIFGNFPY